MLETLFGKVTKFKISHKPTILAIIFLIFATIYALISLVNHYLFRTYALDLGMFNQAMYCFSHFKMNYFTLDINSHEINYFGDHFSPIILFFSPFFYLFGSNTLLIIQIIFILFGGLGIFKFVSLKHSNTYLPLIIVLQFFCIWGIYFALSSDFHNNVIAAMMVPWLLYFYEKDNKKAFLLFFILILICKENMALWLAFIVIGLIFKQLMVKRRNFEIKSILKFEIPLIVFSLLYFILIVSFVMPSLNPINEINAVNRYSHLGSSLSEIIFNIIQNPRYIFSLLFESPSNIESTFGVKSELHFMILVSGGYALFYRPYYLVMIIPIYIQKLLTNDNGIWGIGGQYSIEFVPILSMCLSDFLLKIKSRKIAYIIVILTTFSTAWFTYSVMENCKIPWYNKTNIAFYDKVHYATPFHIKEINSALKSIPDKVPISVSSSLAPHLACRERLYHFPVIKDAKFIALLYGNYYPLSIEDFNAKINECIEKDHFNVIYNQYDLIILQKE